MLVNEIHAGKSTMIDCIADVELWCCCHGLKLNADKSDVIWLGTRQQLAKMSEADKDLPLPSGILRVSETVCNLGVITDEHLAFDAQARVCSKTCFNHLRRIRQIKRFIAATSPLVHYITFGLLQRTLGELQRGCPQENAVNPGQCCLSGLLRTSS